MKVLIIKLGAIGDVVHTTVIATAIKQCFKDAEVHFLTVPSMVPLLKEHPHIDKVLEWNPAFRKSFKYLLEVAAIGRKEKYDAVFNMTRALRNILLSYLMFPKKVIGKRNYGKSWVEEYFLTAKSLFPELQLPSRLYLSVSEDAKFNVEELLAGYPSPYFLLFPTGGSDRTRQGRIWGLESWNILAKELLQNYGGTIFVSGSAGEAEYHSSLDDVVVLSGKCSLMETLALMSKSEFVISGDSGPAHMASALGVKTIALCGSTSPDKIKPYGDNGFEVSSPNDCRFCWQKKCKYLKNSTDKITPCMSAITPSMVISKIKNIEEALDKLKL